MSQSTLDIATALLVQHEEYRQFPYEDTTGNLTIGYGRNLNAQGINEIEARNLLLDDIEFCIEYLETIDCYNELSPVRQAVLIDMCYNLGEHGIEAFKNMWIALDKHDYALAAQEISNSKAATQTGTRYKQLANMMLTGEI